jgi:hypothetical protein
VSQASRPAAASPTEHADAAVPAEGHAVATKQRPAAEQDIRTALSLFGLIAGYGTSL